MKGFFLTLLSLFLLLRPVAVFSQEPLDEPVDTTWYVRGDYNYNLLIAAYLGRDDDILRFLNQGAYINTSTMSGNAPLLMAAGQGHLSAVRILLLNGADIHQDNIEGMFPLLEAVLNNHYEVAEYLIEQGADINQTDNLGRSSLLIASAYNFVSIADMLIYHDADVNLPDKQGTTPLMVAVYAGNIGLAQLLMENGSKVDQQDKKGFTPLMVATQLHDTAFVRFLLGFHANLYENNNAGSNAFLIAVAEGDTTLTRGFLNMDTTKAFHKDLPVSPVELARWNNDQPMIRLLQSHGYLRSFSLFLSSLYLNINTLANTRDLFTGMEAGFTEGFTGLSLSAGFQFRPTPVRVLLQERDHYYYQYWETRYNFYGNIHRDWIVLGKFAPVKGGLSLSLAGGYSFGKRYEGTLQYPEEHFFLSPGAGFFYRQQFWQVNLSYRYMDLQTLRIYPHYISLGVIFRLNLNTVSLPQKTVSWY